LLHVIAAYPRNCYSGRYWTNCSNARVRGLPPEIRDTTEVVTECDSITELIEVLFDGTGLCRLQTLVFDHTQQMNVGKNPINF
jgi:hypothetical protein